MSAPVRGEPRRALALLVATATFMEFLDGTIIQSALPAIGRDLGVDSLDVPILMAAYFGAVAATIPLCGWLADRLRVRWAFSAGVALFTIASMLCATSGDFGALTLCRILQGIGGGVMVSIGQLVVLRRAARNRLLQVTAYLIWPALLAPVIAPGLGGLITDTIGWRWVFWLNVPIGAACILLAQLVVPAERERTPGMRLDIVGLVLFSGGLCAVVPALSLLDTHANGQSIAILCLGTLSCAAAVLWMLRRTRPLLDLRLFRLSSFRLGNSSGAVYRAAVTAAPVVWTLLFQTMFGWSAALSGLVVMAVFVGNLAIKPAAITLVRRWGFRQVLIVAGVVGALALTASSFLTSEVGTWTAAAVLLVSGAARSVGFTAYSALQFADVAGEQMSDASPLAATMQQIAAAVGVAVATGILSTLLPLVGPWVAFRLTLSTLAAALLFAAISAYRSPRSVGEGVVTAG